VEHDLRCPFPVHIEESLQHHDDKVHRREVIVQQQDLVQRGPRDLGAGFLHHHAVQRLLSLAGFFGHI
jgi:hypothetical protein